MNEEQIGIVGWIVGIISVFWMLLTIVDRTEFELSKKPQYGDGLAFYGPHLHLLATAFEEALGEEWLDQVEHDRCAEKDDDMIGVNDENAPPEEFWTDPDAWFADADTL